MSRSRETDPARVRHLAFEILGRVEGAGAFASVLLDHASSRVADARDTALLHEIVLGVLRHRTSLDHALGAVLDRPIEAVDPELRTVLRIGAHGLLRLDRVPDFAAVDTAVRVGRHAGGPRGAAFVNGVLRALASRDRAAVLPPAPATGDVSALALYHSHPEWLVARWVARRGWDAAAALCAANNLAAPTVVRPNLARIEAEALQALLSEDGLAPERGRFVPEALRVVGSPRRSAALAQGLGWVQDEAAQLVPALFGRLDGPLVADLCAAPGAKALQLAAMLPADGSVLASDRHLGRLGRLARLAQRVGERRLRLVVADATRPLPYAIHVSAALVDAPCSGTGTLRRRPEIRWRLGEDDPLRLAERQLELLLRAAELVGPRGRVVYSVCSLESEEGEGVVRRFLERRPDFALVDPRDALGPAAAALVEPPGFLHTSPASGGLDGFFAARLERGGA